MSEVELSIDELIEVFESSSDEWDQKAAQTMIQLRQQLEAAQEEVRNQHDMFLQANESLQEVKELIKKAQEQQAIGFVQPYVLSKGLAGYTATINPEIEGPYVEPVYAHPPIPADHSDGWRSMDSAPIGGDRVIVLFETNDNVSFCGDYLFNETIGTDGAWINLFGQFIDPVYAKGWMPFPSALQSEVKPSMDSP